MKITKDGFIFKTLNSDEAKTVFSSGAFALYRLNSDDTESLIESFDELNECFENGIEIGIEVGQLSTNDCKQTLENQGFYTEKLWSVVDVIDNYDCDNETALKILDKGLNNDATMEQCWYAINEEAQSMGLMKKEYF